jgi:hypothetical protein
MYRTQIMTVLVVLASWSAASQAQADTFGGGANSFSIEFVTIGDPGNPPDTTGNPNPAGSVPYAYRIGKFEISRDMIEKVNAEGALGITLADMTLFGGNGPDKPATGVSWLDAARFVNWLNVNTGSVPAYTFDAAGDFQLWAPGDAGYDANNLYRNSLAKFFLPSADEWYKAAYYDPISDVYWDYPTASNSAPVGVASGTMPGTAVVQQGANGPADITQAGGLSAYGTMAQGGNVNELEESAFDLANSEPLELRGGRGGNWDAFPSGLHAGLRSGGLPFSEGPGAGFRVARVIPEPNAATLLTLALLGLLGIGRGVAGL